MYGKSWSRRYKLLTWWLCDRASLVQWYQQPTRCSKICIKQNFFKFALHISGDSFANLQEHFDFIYSFLEHCSKKLYIESKCSWIWAKLSPGICRASLKESIKQILLHLVGYWCRYNLLGFRSKLILTFVIYLVLSLTEFDFKICKTFLLYNLSLFINLDYSFDLAEAMLL